MNCAAAGKEPVMFFAFEWVNPRFGKIIQEIRLKGSRDFKRFQGQIIPSNAIALLTMSIVKRRETQWEQTFSDELEDDSQ